MDNKAFAEKAKADRTKALFIPLRTEWFRAFESGTKDTEYRAYGPRWKDGTPIAMQVESIFRYLPYKPNSQQAKRGEKGRWQEMNEFGGWENCAHPFGNKWRLAELPSKSTNEWSDA